MLEVCRRYAQLSETVLGFLSAFSNSYMAEAGFSHIALHDSVK